MLKIDPEEGDEDGEVKPVKIKIDQNLFTYAAKIQRPQNEEQVNSSGHVPVGNDQAHIHHQVPQGNDMGHQQYAVIANPVVRVVSFHSTPELLFK